jgi:ribulose kinase
MSAPAACGPASSSGEDAGPALHDRICARIAALRAAEGWDLAGRLHVLPDFMGNHSPLADPGALGVISGLDLDRSFDGLCRLYRRAAVGIALGLRHIVERLAPPGGALPILHAAGGHTRNPLLMQLYADATGCRLVEPGAEDAMLLGTAMVAAPGAGLYPNLAAARAMRQPGPMRAPDPSGRARLARDYLVYLEMHAQRRGLDAILAGGAPEGDVAAVRATSARGIGRRGSGLEILRDADAVRRAPARLRPTSSARPRSPARRRSRETRPRSKPRRPARRSVAASP